MRSETTIAEEQVDSPHYLKTVAELGDTKAIHATCDIYSTTGIKLLSHGAPVNSTVYQHLLNHKLIPRLDSSLAMEGSITHEMLTEEATTLQASDRHLRKLPKDLTDDLLALFTRIPIAPGIAFKLGVMREKRQELFQHSLFIAMVSAYIGHQAGLNETELEQIVTAALLHDIGILHVDPGLLDRSKRMSVSERRHLYAHPLTAWLILREYREYTDKVMDGVLQHHERLDGSGYPQNLNSDQIGIIGQIIAVAEIVASRPIREDEQFDWLRLETILKLNSRRYGNRYIGYLKIFAGDEREIQPCPQMEKKRQLLRLYAISGVLAIWESSQVECQKEPVCHYVGERMRALKMEVLDAGLNPYVAEENILGMDDSPRACVEARILLEEIFWQIKEILIEVRRRWPDIERKGSKHHVQPISDWMSDVESLLDSAEQQIA